MYLDHELGDDAVKRVALGPDALLTGPNMYGVGAYTAFSGACNVWCRGPRCRVKGPGVYVSCIF